MATPLIPSSSSGSGSGSGITTHQVSKPQQQKQINEIQDQANDHDTSVDIVPETIDMIIIIIMMMMMMIL